MMSALIRAANDCGMEWMVYVNVAWHWLQSRVHCTGQRNVAAHWVQMLGTANSMAPKGTCPALTDAQKPVCTTQVQPATCTAAQCCQHVHQHDTRRVEPSINVCRALASPPTPRDSTGLLRGDVMLVLTRTAGRPLDMQAGPCRRVCSSSFQSPCAGASAKHASAQNPGLGTALP